MDVTWCLHKHRPVLYVRFRSCVIENLPSIKELNSLPKVATYQVCRCISELCRHRSYYSNSMLSECQARTDIPHPEVQLCCVYINDIVFVVIKCCRRLSVLGHVFQELFARLVVLLHDPLAREQLATQILTVRASSFVTLIYIDVIRE